MAIVAKNKKMDLGRFLETMSKAAREAAYGAEDARDAAREDADDDEGYYTADAAEKAASRLADLMFQVASVVHEAAEEFRGPTWKALVYRSNRSRARRVCRSQPK